MSRLQYSVRREDWPLVRPFVIARGTTTCTTVIVVEIDDGQVRGRGESCPVDHNDETPESVTAQAAALLKALTTASDWDALHDRAPPGAARNAVDCAVWDLRAKQAGQPAWRLLGLGEPRAVETVYTISIAAPEAMAAAARASAHRTLKLKLDAGRPVDCVRAVRAAVPDRRLIADANESWTPALLREALPALAACGVELLEQPLPRGQDAALADVAHAVPVGADESCHTRTDLRHVSGLYDVVNIKLDKTGGLTEALRLRDEAGARGLGLMTGCMVGTSLAMAPAHLIAQTSRFVDLDAPLLIGRDREEGLRYRGDLIEPPQPALWG